MRLYLCPLRPGVDEDRCRGPGGSWLPLGQRRAGPHFPSLPPAPGPSLSCFHWPRGVQACARLQQLLEWTRSAGFGEAAERFFRKLSCTLNLLATPRAQLIQVRSAESSGAGASGLRELAEVPQLAPPVVRIMAPKMSASSSPSTTAGRLTP